MSPRLNFRRARPEQSELLASLTMEGLYYWGYREQYPELMASFKDNQLPTTDYIAGSPVFLAEEDGHVIGYFGLELHPQESFVDLKYMFLDTAYIGRGYGKELWISAVREATKTGYSRMRIISDPKAVGFYEAMGAERNKDIAVMPDFTLTEYWFQLDD